MGKLYIIGNGFDLHYGLRTRTEDFLLFLKRKPIYSSIENAVDVMAGYGVCWSNFEEDISYIDFDEIEANQLGFPDYSSDRESDRDGCIFNMQEHLNSIYVAIFSALYDMAISADKVEVPRNLDFAPDDAIISFNYTITVEKAARTLPLRPILYIHGRAASGDKLVLGYHEEQRSYNFDKYTNEDGDYYLEVQLELMKDFYRSLKKKRREKELRDYLSTLTGITEIIVLGHSIGKVDVPYFELIDTYLAPQQWRVSYYSEADQVLSNIKQLSFVNKIRLFNW